MKINWFQSLTHSSKFGKDTTSILILLAVWIGMVILVNPIGDFPLNDDWAYGWTVKTLMETGDYQLSDWTATNLLPQALWGTLFCLPFGFSFTALRLSALTLGFIGILSTYGLLRTVGTTSRLALLGALMVALNPIYFGSANSFNSDVPSFALGILALYFMARGLQQDTLFFTRTSLQTSITSITSINRSTLLGILIACLALLNRQSNIVILVAFGLAVIVRQGLKPSTLALATFPTLLGLLLQIGYSQWLTATGKMPLLYGFQVSHLRQSFAAGLPTLLAIYLKNGRIMAVYLGLFLFPFLVTAFIGRFRRLALNHQRLSVITLLSGLAFGVVSMRQGSYMPFVGNLLEPFGLGPQAFDGYSSILTYDTQVAIIRGWRLLTLVGFLGAGLLILYLVPALLTLRPLSQNQNPADRHAIAQQRGLFTLILASALLYFGLIGALSKDYWFDRYLIFFLPLLMVLIALLSPPQQPAKLHPSLIGLALILVLLSGLTVGLTHDYLAWNRVRWQALNSLTETAKVPPAQIYGGFEFNGWHFGNRLKTCNPHYQNQSQSTGVDWGTFSCLWGNNTETYSYVYTMGFRNKPGYTLHQSYPFHRWFPWTLQDIYILKKSI